MIKAINLPEIIKIANQQSRVDRVPLYVLLHATVRKEQLRVLLSYLRPLLEVNLYRLLLLAHLLLPSPLRTQTRHLIRTKRRPYV